MRGSEQLLSPMPPGYSEALLTNKMTTPKFTPGPWTLYQKSDQRVRVIGKQQRHISTMADPAIDDDARIQAANARLIASAPDLYAALEALLAHEGHPLTVPAKGACHSFVIPNHAIAAARAALAKARGMKGGE